MALESFKASAPGSLMLLGEYAVLRGHPALVCAIDRCINVTLTPRDDDRIDIISELAEHRTTRDALEPHPALQFVMSALKSVPELPSGLSLVIESDFSSKMGLGSSAAVTVASLHALNQWLSQPMTPQTLWQQAIKVIHAVQGKGSGADIAASIMGGVLLFQNNPLTMESIKVLPPLTVIFSGNKTPTSEALKRVSVSTEWDSKMRHLTEQALIALRENNWENLGLAFNEAQSLMVELGVSNSDLETITQTLRMQSSIWGAKISGSGLGDCVIGLGHTDSTLAFEQLPIGVGETGVERII